MMVGGWCDCVLELYRILGRITLMKLAIERYSYNEPARAFDNAKRPCSKLEVQIASI